MPLTAASLLSLLHHTPAQIASFVRQHLYDASTRQLLRVYTNGPSSVPGFADDYACEHAGHARHLLI